METVSCEICGGVESQLIFTGQDRLLGLPGSFNVVRCVRCGLLYTNPRPDSQELPFYYPASYGVYAAEGGEAVRLAIYQRHITTRIHRWVKKQKTERGRQDSASPCGRMLDVGCADGTFLNEMRNLGWETTGLEMDARTAERARSTRGLEIVTGVVDAVEFPAGSFDLITLSHVLEHLPHPRQALQRVRGWLKEGGLLFLTLPNSDCWERRSFGQYWIQWDLPRHFYHFTPETLGRLLREEGFPIVNTHYLSGMYVLQSLRCRNLGGAPCPPAPGAPAGAPRELLKTLIWRLRLFIGSLLGGLVRGELQEVLARKS